MWNYVGLVRSGRRLDRARRLLTELRHEIEDFYRHGAMSDALVGLRNGVHAALEIAAGGGGGQSVARHALPGRLGSRRGPAHRAISAVALTS